MFGNRKKSLQEEIVEDKTSEIIQDAFMEIKESENRMQEDMQQVNAHIVQTSSYLKEDMDLSEELEQSIECYRNAIEKEKQTIEKMTELAETLSVNLEALVEQNKHFTSPSKRLTGVADGFKEIDTHYQSELDTMNAYGKQMGVLALNAAIEAGRMGESGKSFVNAAEEIRALSKSYENSVLTMREIWNSVQTEFVTIEESIQQMIHLLKENNLSGTKAFKQSLELKEATKELSTEESEQMIVQMQEKVMGICKNEQELYKITERSRMQIEDIEDEIALQQKCRQEIQDTIENR